MQNDVELEERDFFANRLTEEEIRNLASSVGIYELFSRRSPSLKQMGLGDQALSEEQMVQLMLQEPRLIRRPIIDIRGKLLVGANQKAVEQALTGAYASSEYPDRPDFPCG